MNNRLFVNVSNITEETALAATTLKLKILKYQQLKEAFDALNQMTRFAKTTIKNGTKCLS